MKNIKSLQVFYNDTKVGTTEIFLNFLKFI